MTERDTGAAPDTRIRTEPCTERVTVVFDGRIVADSRRAVVLHETGLPDIHYLPPEDVDLSMLEPSAHATHCPHKGDASYWSLTGPGRRAENAVWSYLEPIRAAAEIRGLLAFHPSAVDEIRVER